MKKRIFGLDLIKVFAILCVIFVHFFYNTQYYSSYSNNINLKIQDILRNFFMICVPIFLILSGYLNNQKNYNRKFFYKLLGVLLIWIVYSLVEYSYNCFFNNDIFSLKNLLYSISSFSANHYSWYIKVYIFLYLLSPMINCTFAKFTNKNKVIIIIILMNYTILPNILNLLFCKSLYFPDNWINMYPITYYMIGKFIYYEKININKKILSFCLFLNLIFTILYNFFVPYIDYFDLPVFINSIIIFLLLYNCDCKNKKVKEIMSIISSLSLDIYLSSSLVDKIIYPYFYEKVFNYNITQEQILFYFPILAFLIFAFCFCISWVRVRLINIRGDDINEFYKKA